MGNMGEQAAHPLGRGAPLFLGRFSGSRSPGPRFEDPGEAPRLQDPTRGQGRVKERVESSRKRQDRASASLALQSQKR